MKKIAVYVDVQKDFISGALRNEKAIELTPKIVEFAKVLKSRGYRAYLTQDTHERTSYAEDGKTPIAGYLATLEGKKLPVQHCVYGTDGWQIDPNLLEVFDVLPGLGGDFKYDCKTVEKPTFGSFKLADEIEKDSRGEGVEIVMCGFVTSICLLSNAIILRARFPDARIVVLKDLCAGVGGIDHEAALTCLQMQQVDIVDSADYAA